MKVEGIVNNFSYNKIEKNNNINSLGKDDFLKILLTQLKYQDPSNPIKDQEFIAQMAQFSSLEQMQNLNSSFERLASQLSFKQELDLLGRIVEFVDQDGQYVKGLVSNVRNGERPQIMVDNKYYEYKNIISVGMEG